MSSPDPPFPPPRSYPPYNTTCSPGIESHGCIFWLLLCVTPSLSFVPCFVFHLVDSLSDLSPSFSPSSSVQDMVLLSVERARTGTPGLLVAGADACLQASPLVGRHDVACGRTYLVQDETKLLPETRIFRSFRQMSGLISSANLRAVVHRAIVRLMIRACNS